MSEEIISEALGTYYQIAFLHGSACTNRAQKFTSPNSLPGLSVIFCSVHRDLTQKSNLALSFSLNFKLLMKFRVVSSLAFCVLFMNYLCDHFVFKLNLETILPRIP